LLGAAVEALGADYPNPERIGCPDGTMLDAVAARRVSFPDLNEVIDHIAMCTPCFVAYRESRQKYRAQRNRNGVIAGLVVLVALVVVWYVTPAFRRSHVQQSVAKVSPFSVVLDFSARTTERSDQVQPSPQPAPRIPRAVLSVEARLPLGTEDGQYSVEFRDSTDRALIETTGIARWNGATETLTTSLDLRQIRPGEYTIALRKGPSSWHKYPVAVD
jgi:hypothetical protein